MHVHTYEAKGTDRTHREGKREREKERERKRERLEYTDENGEREKTGTGD